MTPTLLTAVVRRADLGTSDADLLARYARDRDPGAFEELVRRHGGLVWAACRTLLPDRTDAEDAFQAVFLALVRGAGHIRDGRAVPAWLHGVAVRVATRARRAAARRKARERRAAAPEADRPVSDETWAALAAALHEEVARLPEPERCVFVLCELQGVPQPDAAARLGAPLGSVSGRLCKARQRLLDRLAARGVAPAAAVGVGLTATSANAGAVPPALMGTVSSFPGSSAAATSAATALARGLTEGVVMRMKLLAASVVIAAMGLTSGAVWLANADAQPPAATGGAGAPPGMGGSSGPPPGGFFPGGGGPGGAPVGAPPAGGGGPGGGGDWARFPSSSAWEYKFVDTKSDRKAFEAAINQHGKDGWEFCSSERFAQGELVLVFKKKKGGDWGGGFGVPAVPGVPAPPGGGRWGGIIEAGNAGVDTLTVKLKNADAAALAELLRKQFGQKGLIVATALPGGALLVVGSPDALRGARKVIEENDTKATDPKPAPLQPLPPLPPLPPGPGGGGTATPAPKAPATTLTVIALKNATANEVTMVLKKVFPTAEVVAEPRSNQVIVRTDTATLTEMKALIEKLDVVTPK